VIRVGIVGYGFAGRGFHGYLVKRVPGLQLTAAVTRDAARRAQAETMDGLRCFSSLEDMLTGDSVDLVILATPHNTHFALAMQAMAAGKHVVIDKPMALTLAEADALLAERDRTGVVLSVFHNRRWDWDYLTVKQVLASGQLGSPYLFETAVLRYKAPRGWRGNTADGGGLVYDWGAHLVDQALQLVEGPLDTVGCDIQYRGWGAGAGSYVKLTLRFASDVLFTIDIGNLAAIGKPRWYVLGEAGALLKTGLDPQEPAMLAGDIEAANEAPENRALLTWFAKGCETTGTIESIRGDWTGYYENIRDTLMGQATLAVKPEEARRVVAVLEAATVAAATRIPQRHEA
jgi:scyllo-inositol 2-dehydrogenase (NADP+)